MHAVACGDVEMGGGGGLRLARLRTARRSAARQPLGESTERVERFGTRFTVQLLFGNGLHVRRGEPDAERLGARRAVEEAQQGEDLGRFLRRELETPHLGGAHEARALAAVIVDLEVIEALASYFQRLALPQQRMRRGRVAWCGAKRRLILHDDRDPQGKLDHRRCP